MKFFSVKRIAFFISVLFLIVGFLTLPHYGINWDEPVHFMRGQAYLHYFLTGKKDYSDLSNFKSYYQKPDAIFFNPVGISKNQVSRRSIYQSNGYTANSLLTSYDDYGHPPLGGELAASFNYIFFQKLGFVGDIDSHHLFVVFAASVLVGSVFLWLATEYGILAGVVSALSLALYPLFLGESHFNVKDIPETVFYSLTILIFYKSVKYRNSKLIFVSAIFCGLALATKYNIAFASIILAIWLVTYIPSFRTKLKSFSHLILPIVLYIPIAFSVLVASWPLMWPSPFQAFVKSIGFYRGIGTGGGFDARYLSIFGINTYPAQWILFTTPLVILFFSFFGIFYALRFGFKEKHKTSLLILVWFLVPILRVTVPGASIYGGIRQIMEYIPAMAILSGIGAAYFMTIIRKKLNLKKVNILIFLIIISFIPIIFKLISIHPNEGVYFNPLIGGMKGAMEKDLPSWGESLGNPYRQALTWIDNNADKNAKLVLTYGLGSNLPSILIRPDLTFHNMYRGLDTRFSEYAIGLTNKSPYQDTYYSRYLEKILEPVFEVKVDGVSVAKVWKNDLQHTKIPFKNYHLFLEKIESSRLGTEIFIDLGRVVDLRKLSYEVNKGTCKKYDDTTIIYTSIDSNKWKDSDSDFGRRYVESASDVSRDGEFSHFFAAEKVRFIKINYVVEASCLSNARNLRVYVY